MARAPHELQLRALLFDLLAEEEAANRERVFDIPPLAERLVEAAPWLGREPATRGCRVGYLGARTGVGAALVAAASFYDDFRRVEDEVVREILGRAAAPPAAVGG